MARVVRSEKDEVRGERFRDICRKLFPGRSRADVGAVLGGVSVSTIRNWEKGYPVSLDVLSRLEQLGVSLAYLLRGEGPVAAQVQAPAPISAAPDPVAAAGHPPADAGDPKRLARIIGANLRHLRKKLFPGWGGQKKFAEYLGLAANDLCVYEYGRIVPNELRQEEMAKRLGLTLNELREPLPGVTVPPPPTAVAGALEPAEQARRELEGEIRQQVARLEGRLDAVQAQVRDQDERILRLQESNYALRLLLYEAMPSENRERREALMERLEQSIRDLSRRRDSF